MALMSGKTMTDFQSEWKTESSSGRMNNLEMGAAMTSAAAFKNMGESPSQPADLLGSDLESSSCQVHPYLSRESCCSTPI